MKVTADLHIHSHYSRATSSRLTPGHLERWARIKGINLLGSGDCTHPQWLKDLNENCEEAEEGLYVLRDEVRRAFDAGPALSGGLPLPSGALPRFVLSGEVSTIYKKDGKIRKVHHVVLLPGIKAAAVFQTRLERIGNIRADGRPIIGVSSRDLLELLLESDERSMLIPAHIWTPWFSALGARSGFDSIDECYGDLAPYISAVETGLSSNPPMNWALSRLDRFAIVSNSDAHSPEKLGREATIFNMELSYSGLREAITKNNIIETVEFFPQEGKYHYDGHRNCGVCLGPEQAAAVNGICPVCGRPLTAGVMRRVQELSDRPVSETETCPSGFAGTNRRPYRSLIPLQELVSELLETGTSSKKTQAAYSALIGKGGSELSLLMEMPTAEIAALRCPGVSGELLALAIDRMRKGEVSVSPGFDGEYGVVRAFAPGAAPDAGAYLFEIPGGHDAGISVPGAGSGRRPASGAPVLSERSRPGVRSVPVKALRLDPAQEAAVSYEGNYAVIIAGPGAGKTAVLAARITRLIKEGRAPSSILAISFTVKAAAELGSRIAAAGEHDVTATTFHALCACILREQAAAAGLPPDFKILSEDERDAALKEICDAGDNPRKRVKPKSLGAYIEWKKIFLLLPGEAKPEFPETDDEKEELYRMYRKKLRASGRLDFDDLVAGTVRLFTAKPDILSVYNKRFLSIFVDEYQDINFAQYMLICLLSKQGAACGSAPSGDGSSPPGDSRMPSLWVIGDPNQAIYGFRGSDKRFIDRFTEDYPKAKRFYLNRTFRCAAPIINAAGKLVDAHLAGPEDQADLFRTEYPTEKSEAEGIARRIERIIGGASFFSFDSNITDGNTNSVIYPGESSGGSLAECAILLRTMSLAPPVIKALGDHGIPFERMGDKPWWEEEPVKSLLDWLWETQKQQTRGTSHILRRTSSLRETICTAWDTLRGGLSPAQVTPGTEAAVKKAGKKPEFLQRLCGLAELYRDLPLFLDSLRVSGCEGVPELRRSGVKIMSIHASKGLEFDHVFVPALEEGLVPFTLFDTADESEARRRADQEERIAEEKRLLYVAMTRSRGGLYLSWSRSRTFRGRKLTAGPSRFLEKLEDLVPPAQTDRPIKRDPQLRLF
jgi:uncharacterized protein (TIGR00375 family)